MGALGKHRDEGIRDRPRARRVSWSYPRPLCHAVCPLREDASDRGGGVPTAFHLAALSRRGRVAHDDKLSTGKSVAFGRPAASSSRSNLDTGCRWTVLPGSSGAERQLRALALLVAGELRLMRAIHEAAPVRSVRQNTGLNPREGASPDRQAELGAAGLNAEETVSAGPSFLAGSPRRTREPPPRLPTSLRSPRRQRLPEAFSVRSVSLSVNEPSS